MGTLAAPAAGHAAHPVSVHVDLVSGSRNRLTVAFRLILAIPHLALVGAPVAASWVWSEMTEGITQHDWLAGGGVLGAVACVSALIAWFAILFTGRYPEGMRSLATLYLRWRVRASAYVALLSDVYPPFGDDNYPATLELAPPPDERNRVLVAFRPILVIPQAIVLGLLGVAWVVTTIIAWFAILLTGEYPPGLYRFGVDVLQYTTRVEAYMLLLHDEYPPFSLG